MERKRTKRPRLDSTTQQLIPSEYQECKSFWQYAIAKGFDGDLIKNANERKGGESWFIQILYAIGFRKGLLDYHYIVANEKYHGLWIEMKRIDQRDKKKSQEQNEWIEKLLKRGHYASYAYGVDEAIKIYMDYVNNRL